MKKQHYSKASELINLESKYIASFNEDSPLDEYPRPYLKRENWVNLNGWWEFYLEVNTYPHSIINKEISISRKFNENIVVPYSVESFASKVNKSVEPNDLMWYRRYIQIDEIEEESNYILNFEKVDQECQVFVNNVKVFEHSGGYLPFSVEITNNLIKGDNELIVLVKDFTNTSFYTFGKQTLKRGDIWYTPASGIIGSVWYEKTPKSYIKDLIINTDVNSKKVVIDIIPNSKLDEFSIDIYDYDNQLITTLNNQTQYIFDQIHLWDYKTPYLYHLLIMYGKDKVYSHFSFKENGKTLINNKYYPTINNKPFFINGLLDQGYYSSSNLTPLTYDEMRSDIVNVKELGFNTLRKHIKVESRLFYYECDKIGINLIQDFPSTFTYFNSIFLKYLPFLGFSFSDKFIEKKSQITHQMKEYFKNEMKEIVLLLKKHPSIFCYTLFNEAWGQFDTKNTYDFLYSLDNTRLIDATSGWYDRHIGDFYSTHRYIFKFHYKNDPIKKRIVFLSEFGGYTLPLQTHMTNLNVAGYNTYKDIDELTINYEKLISKQIIPTIKKGLSGIIYTQVSDVEDEVNGLYTFDRKVLKIKSDVIKKLNFNIYQEFEKTINK
jgi:beta-galactosidase/beta-glucuronidase